MIFLPENLKKYWILKKLTQEDVAGYLGITSQSVSKWERGEAIQPLIQQELNEAEIDENIKLILLADGKEIW